MNMKTAPDDNPDRLADIWDNTDAGQLPYNIVYVIRAASQDYKLSAEQIRTHLAEQKIKVKLSTIHTILRITSILGTVNDADLELEDDNENEEE